MVDAESEMSEDVPGVSDYSDSGGYMKEYVRPVLESTSGQSAQNSSEGEFYFSSSSDMASQTNKVSSYHKTITNS